MEEGREQERNDVERLYLFVIESVLTFSITVWFGSASIHNKNRLEGIVKTASKITGSKLPSIESIYTTRTLCKATTIISDSTHPANHLFESLPSGKQFRSMKTRTTRFSNSFYPKAVQTKPPNTNSKEQEGIVCECTHVRVCVWVCTCIIINIIIINIICI